MSNKPIYSFIDEYSFLSNFYPAIVEYEGMVYSTVEHAYQAAKTLSLNERKAIQNTVFPGKAKKIGRSFFLRSDWEEIKLSVMENLLIQKFSLPIYTALLLGTKDSLLVEGNTWHDNFWGDCICEKCEEIEGQNHLGKLLMKIRGNL